MAYAAQVVMLGLRPHVTYMVIASTGDPLSIEQLKALDLSDAVDAMVQWEAMQQTPPPEWTVEQLEQMETPEGFADVLDEQWLSSRKAAQKVPAPPSHPGAARGGAPASTRRAGSGW